MFTAAHAAKMDQHYRHSFKLKLSAERALPSCCRIAALLRRAAHAAADGAE
jgi:hypothetical protein